jgi:hypothetical protein
VFLLLFVAGCSGARVVEKFDHRPLIVIQPSHQNDTGRDFNEALVCNAIADAVLAAPSDRIQMKKVWSYNEPGLHHAQQGSNTKRSHTVDVDSGKISGYAFELQESNALRPDVFVAIHNNGGTRRDACWGFVHEGDSREEANRKLAALLVKAVCKASGLQNAGVHGDSEPNRNDYRCATTGKLAFYSLDENVNVAPYRVLLEIGDNAVSRALLVDPNVQEAIGKAIKSVLLEQCTP